MTEPLVAVARADVRVRVPPPDASATASSFEPYIPPSAHLPELTVLPLIVGTLLGAIFGASSLYLVLKVGLTVSASIPVAVISITLFRLLSKFGLRDATILENNIVQTAGSAGESIAFGLGVTMPAIMILGFDLEITRVALVAVLGGLLGILMMIPLRRALIVQQHGILKYPGRHRVRRGPEGRRVGRVAGRFVGVGQTRARGARRRDDQRDDDLHRLRRRPRLQSAERRVQRLEGRAAEDLRRAVRGRVHLGGDLAGAARRRLHHRPPHRVDDVRRRRAGVPGADSRRSSSSAPD